MDKVNYLDIIILLPIIYGLVRGLMRGFVVECAAITGMIAGLIAARIWAPPFAAKILQVLEMPEGLAQSLSYVLLFVGVTLFCKAIARLINRLLKAISLSWLNRLAGGLFGGLKWALIISVVLNLLLLPEQYVQIIKEEAKQSSVLYQPILRIASISWDKMQQYLPSLPSDENKKKVIEEEKMQII